MSKKTRGRYVAAKNTGGSKMKKYAFGIDVGGTTCKIGFFETNGKLIDKWEIKTNTENNGAAILSDIAQAVDNKLAQEGISKDDVQGVGIGVPGPVKSNGVVNRCVNLGWGIVNVEEELGNLTGLKVKAGNDANVAALGEMWQGAAKGCKDVIMVTLGTGVGGGIVLDGKIVKGTHGAAGEIGHMSVVYDETATCNCGKKGCLEQVASATGIVKEAKKFLAADGTPSTLRNIEGFTAKDVFDEAKKGDEISLKTVNRLGEYLGIALGHIACVIDPDVFIIGGGVSKAGDFLIDTIEKYYVEKTYHQCRKTPIKLATLGNSAGIYGAAKLVISE